MSTPLQCDCGYNITVSCSPESRVYFGPVEITDAITQEKEVTPSFKEQIIEPDAGYTSLSQVKVNAIDASVDVNIKPENIRKGIEILGVVGTYSGEEETGPGGTIRVDTYALLPAIGNIDYIYIVKDENALYRWDENNLTYIPVARDYEEIELIDCDATED